MLDYAFEEEHRIGVIELFLSECSMQPHNICK